MKRTSLIRCIVWLCLCASFSSVYAQQKKVVYIIMDGIPASCIERLHPQTIFSIAAKGAYSRGYTGGTVGMYSQTPTISAVGYNDILTGTWSNKHHVFNNSDQKPNYNYWSLFRIAKAQTRNVKTALFSSWTDNRTMLIGAGKKETDSLKIDYVYDGYELDKVHYPDKKNQRQIFEIDSVVTCKAADCIRKDAPDFSWTYLWYTDDAFHMFGNGKYSDEYVLKTDALIANIWNAVQYREKNFGEQWMIIVTTDHGRTENGHGHGGQSATERCIWMSTNIKNVNGEFGSPLLSHVDILPTICRYMNFKVPEELARELDGISFIGRRDIYDLQSTPYDRTITLHWKSAKVPTTATIYITPTNKFAEGGHDVWVKAGSVLSTKGEYKIDLSRFPTSDMYKVDVCTSDTHLNRWVNMK